VKTAVKHKTGAEELKIIGTGGMILTKVCTRIHGSYILVFECLSGSGCDLSNEAGGRGKNSKCSIQW